jgi:hypothetical protein
MADQDHPGRYLESDWGKAEVWPFIEDENAYITGYGHQDPDEFAAAVRHYDFTCNGEMYEWSADDVGHAWVRLTIDGEKFLVCEPTEPGAFPVTTMWSSR